MRIIWLRVRMALCIVFMCAALFALLSAIGYLAGAGTPIFYALFAFILVGFQFIIGPKMVERFMGVKYVSPSENPRLHAIVDELSYESRMKKPKGVSSVPIPNAFAFGRTKRDVRVCVTKDLLNRLNDG